MLRIFTTQTTLRENTQPYRFWGLKIFTPLTLRFQDFQRSKFWTPFFPACLKGCAEAFHIKYYRSLPPTFFNESDNS
jgi:hypothetical protein